MVSLLTSNLPALRGVDKATHPSTTPVQLTIHSARRYVGDKR